MSNTEKVRQKILGVISQMETAQAAAQDEGKKSKLG